jgi:hypothetical protein
MASFGACADKSSARGAKLWARLFVLATEYSAHFLAELINFPTHLRRQGQ